MDPNQWRNYNQAYGHIGHSSGLSPTAANLNRFDLPLLNADPTLGTGLGLAPSLQSHPSSMSSARSMGGLGALPSNYPLHNTMSPFLDAVNPLPSAFPAQSPYKSLGQSSFGIEASSLRSPDQPSLYGFTSVADARSHSKSIYAQDTLLSKEQQLSYGISSSLSPLSSIEKSSKSTSWNLSNFVPNPSNPFGNLSNEVPSSLSDLVGPPPAHSGNTSTSRHSTIQRNHFPSDLFSHVPLNNKPSRSYSLDKPEDLLLASPTLQLSRSGLSDSIFTSPTHHGIENLTKPTSQHNSIFGFPPNSSALKSELSSNYQQQLSSDINYDPVSPPTPLSDGGQQQQNDIYTNVGLHDISPMSHSQHGLLPQKQKERLVQDAHQVIMHAHSGKSGSVQNIPMELNKNLNQMSNSPMQQSPISVGGSPHMSVPMSSPQTPLPSSTVVQAPPPIQAVADSTTKPKRVRSRKKKVSVDQENGQKYSPEGMTSHMVNQHGDMMGMALPMSNSGHMMSMGSQSFNQTNPYSPQKSQPYSPHTHPQYSPKKTQAVSPQSYSPQITSQAMVDKVYNHQQSPSIEEQFSMQHSANLSSQNQMSLPSNSNHMSLMSDSVIHNGGQGSVIHSMAGESIRQSLQSQGATPSPPEQQRGHMSVNSLSLSDIASTPLADAIVGNNTNYNYNSVPGQSFVEQLQSDSNIDHLNKSPMNDPMSIGQLDLQGQQGTYVSPQQQQQTGYIPSQPGGYVSQQPNSIYTDLDNYNNQYENAHSSLTSPSLGYENSPHPNNTSTIDEDALSSLIGNPTLRDTSPMKELSPEYWRHRTKAEEKVLPMRTVTSQVEFDDDFAHLTKPPDCEKKDKKPNVKPLSNSLSVINPSMHSVNSTPVPVQIKPEQNIAAKKSNSNSSSFMDSFLSFIQGKKPETLSSLNTSNVKKPELPKYIPEPRRPRPVESSDSAASTPRPDTDNKSEFSSNTGINSPSTSQNDDTVNSQLAFSDDDDESANLTSTVENVLSHLNEDGTRKEGLKMRISFSKITGGGKKQTRKSSGKVLSGSQRGKQSKLFSDNDTFASSGDEDYTVGSSEEEAAMREEREPTPPPPEPTRHVSSRKAKDKGRKVYKDSSDSDISLDLPGPISKGTDSDVEYDSDKDPAWTPFAVDNKRQPTFDALDYRGAPAVPKKGRHKSGKGRGRVKMGSKRLSERAPTARPFKIQKSKDQKETNNTSVPDGVSESDTIHNLELKKEGYQMGDFILDKKDLNKFENFPIWRIESGKLIRKYELITEEGQMRHRAMCTFSSWVPIMQKDYLSIRTKYVGTNNDKEVVEVFEADRPTPKLDSYLEHAYEEDPLADLFNVYLQIFLSQALEPGFLSAIGEGEENFYMGPLQSIDKIIEKKLDEMEEKVLWKVTFKNALRAKPHIRELDRPNLKLFCQACENASQPAIKSIHLFGQSYDHFTLDENTSSATEGGSLEFMIGKTAASYVGPYHSLYHFKYNLYKRCLAKVDIVRQSDHELDNAEVLDRCLNNRTWVLKIFDDLKNMLDKG
ncbi:uncharacterized protein LOC110445106 [Mizuhopecten yessoensis]|uniref:uncharacterized protein LOC110445106 n=1 Tax=Mizuhopecten yessoensis TaxID=6573 RepID=UPI000B4578D7|nr:uncharacterized protein LOC110445106 [Mizuhopecten yessoensis]